MWTLRKIFVGLVCLVVFASCGSSSVDDAIDLAQGIPRKTIDRTCLGINAFLNDTRFGSAESQAREVRDTLKLNEVRLLFAWNDGVQSAPGADPDFSFYDSLLAALPSGMRAIIVLTGLPGWMNESDNWIDGNPRQTFVERWVRPVARRYGGSRKVVGWEIWNEPNMLSDPDNSTLVIATSPENYVEMLAAASSVIRDVAPGKSVINAATTAINQNFPGSLDYNRAMRDAGALSFVDRYAVHYYGRQFENVLGDGRVAEFLNGLDKPIVVTESGAQGVNEQLAYGEQVWPFLIERIPGIERIYIYQFTESSPSSVTYGLRNLDADAPVSDLYVYLRDS